MPDRRTKEGDPSSFDTTDVPALITIVSQLCSFDLKDVILPRAAELRSCSTTRGYELQIVLEAACACQKMRSPLRSAVLVAALSTCRCLQAPHVIGVDVGTQSARAGLFSIDGRMLRSASAKISTFRRGDFVEQSTNEIWNACCDCVRQLKGEESVVGIAFDATCSLVVVDEDFEPLRASDSDERNVVVWMDHRANSQAEEISSKASEKILRTVGGAVSPEMEMPKIRWLYDEYSRDPDWKPGQFFDLTDFLSWRATGNLARSLCTVVCKWNYQNEWDSEFLETIGLGDKEHLFGWTFLAPGAEIGPLTREAAEELGLETTTIVAAGAIDAHAGGIGCVGYGDGGYLDRMALVAGTSACHMISSKDPVFVPGVWGPYDSAMVPGSFLLEGGQSAAGALMDYLTENVFATNLTYAELDRQLESIKARKGVSDVALLTADIHVDPDVNGNRSPLADPSKRAAVLGLSLNDPPEDRSALLYLAACQALAYQTRHIVETVAQNGGPDVKEVVVCGGLAGNPTYLQQHADALGLPVVVPREEEPVLLGAAVLAATAAQAYSNIPDAMQAMTDVKLQLQPTKDPLLKAYHDAKFQIFKEMASDATRYRNTISDAIRPFSP